MYELIIFNIYKRKYFFSVKSKDDLIYDLIFSDKSQYEIDVSEYIEDIYKYEDFILDIKQVLKKSKVKILKSEVKTDPKTAVWELKVTKV